MIPTQWVSFDFSSLGETFGQCFQADMGRVNALDFVVIIFAFLFVDMFDTIGTLIGVANKADMLDENGKLERIKPALLADAIATSAGAILGTSTTTTFVESSSGVSARRKNRSCICSYRFLILTGNHLCSGIYNHSWICNCTGFDLCRIFDGICCC